MNDKKQPKDLGRRRVPRRAFEAPVAVLLGGKHSIERAFQVGEGGMMISCAKGPLDIGRAVVASFFLNAKAMVIVRGIVRNVLPAGKGLPERYGVEFVNLEFHHKREIRNFVASATLNDAA